MNIEPGEQLAIRRRAHASIEKAFEADGIPSAFPTAEVASGHEPTAAVAERGPDPVRPRKRAARAPAPAPADGLRRPVST